jgi:hypothetical protein
VVENADVYHMACLMKKFGQEGQDEPPSVGEAEQEG